MFILSTEMEVINLDLFADYAGMNEELATAPVVALYSNSLPAQPIAISPVEELAQAKDAIATTISQMNMLVLNSTDASYRSQIKNMAAALVVKAPLMQQTKENYLHMLEVADTNAANFYGQPVKTITPVAFISPYKRKYDTANDISQHLATASILKEVASLYYINAELIEATLWLKKQFTDRKARLYRPSTAAA